MITWLIWTTWAPVPAVWRRLLNLITHSLFGYFQKTSFSAVSSSSIDSSVNLKLVHLGPQPKVIPECHHDIGSTSGVVKAQTKWSPFCRKHFQIIFSDWEWFYFDSNFTEVCPKESSWWWISIGSDAEQNFKARVPVPVNCQHDILIQYSGALHIVSKVNEGHPGSEAREAIYKLTS